MTKFYASSAAALLLAASAVAENHGGGSSETSVMFETASRLATAVKAASALTKSDKVDMDTMKNTYICPMADDISDMVEQALKELGDNNPQGKENGMMNKLVGISHGVKKITDQQKISCDGLDNFQKQSDKVQSKLRNRRHKRDDDSDTSDDDSTDDDDYESDFDGDEDDDDYKKFDTVDALSLSARKTLGTLKDVSYAKQLPGDFLCDSIDTTSKTVSKMSDKIESSPSHKVEKEVDNTVRLGQEFSKSADSNNVKCDSQLSSLNKALDSADKKVGGSGTGAGSSSSKSGSSTMSTKTSSAASGTSSAKATKTSGASSASASPSGSKSTGSSSGSSDTDSGDSESAAAADTASQANAAGFVGINKQFVGGACAAAALALL